MLNLQTRFKVMVAVTAVGTLVSGFVSLGERIQYSHPKQIDYTQFVHNAPTQGYFVVKGGALDLASAVLPYESADGYLVPLRMSGETQDSAVHVLVYVTNEPLVRQIDAYNNSAHRDTTIWAMTHQDKIGAPPSVLTVPLTISGMVNHSFNPDSPEGEKIVEKVKTDGALITIDKDMHPNALKAIALIFAGVCLCLFSLQSFGIGFDLSGLKRPGALQPLDGYENTASVPSGVHPGFRLSPGSPNKVMSSQHPTLDNNIVRESKPPSEFLSAEAPIKKTKEEEELERIRAMKTYDPFA